jgi:hypothetical protein
MGGLFIDEGGTDQYHTASGFGDSSAKSIAVSFDLDGKDTYYNATPHSGAGRHDPQ